MQSAIGGVNSIQMMQAICRVKFSLFLTFSQLEEMFQAQQQQQQQQQQNSFILVSP